MADSDARFSGNIWEYFLWDEDLSARSSKTWFLKSIYEEHHSSDRNAKAHFLEGKSLETLDVKL